MRARLALPIVAALALPLTSAPTPARAGGLTATIQVDAGSSLGANSPLLLGHNLNWNTADNIADVTVTSGGAPAYGPVVGLLQQLQVPFVRYPGGLNANCFDWKKSVDQSNVAGPVARGNQAYQDSGNCIATGPARFGVTEFMDELEAMRAPGQAHPPEAELTLNICTKQATTGACVAAGGGTALCPLPKAPPTVATCPGAIDAADLVAYLDGTNAAATSADGATPGSWVQTRINNHHSQPWGVRFFEIGNEVDSAMPASVYADIVKAYATAIRQAARDSGSVIADRDIQIGEVASHDSSWTRAAVVPDANFMIPHMYAPGHDEHTAELWAANGGTAAQSWGFHVPDTAPATASYDMTAYVFPTTDCKNLTAYVDGVQLTLGSAVALNYAYLNEYQCIWNAQLSPRNHVLMLTTTSNSTLEVAAARLLCSDPGCSVPPVDVDVNPYADNPAAIAVLRAPNDTHAIATVVGNLDTAVSGSVVVHVRAFGNPVVASTGSTPVKRCPSLIASIPGAAGPGSQTPPTLLGSVTGCGSPTAPIDLAFTPINAPANTRRVAVSFYDVTGQDGLRDTDADVISLSVTAGNVTATAPDLSYYGSQYPGQQVSSDLPWYASALGESGYLKQVRSDAGRPIDLVASEWNAQPILYSAPSIHESESQRGMLTAALMLQQFETYNLGAPDRLTGANLYTLDGDYYFHVFHCNPGSEADYAPARPCASNQPYLSITGQMFGMLAGHFGPGIISATVSGPSVVAPPTVTSADVMLAPQSTVPMVSAVATRRPGWVDVQLVNVSPDAGGVGVQLTLANATLTGAPSLSTLSGNPDDVDACKLVYVYPPPPCVLTDAVTPKLGVVATSGQTLAMTLPPSSFSVLSLPVA